MYFVLVQLVKILEFNFEIKSKFLLRFKADLNCYFSFTNTNVEDKHLKTALKLLNQVTFISVLRNHEWSFTIIYLIV